MKPRKLLAFTLLAAAWVAAAGHTDEPKKLAGFMRLKLTHSQQLLEGIALEDYTMIAKNSQQLSLLSQDERWQIFQTPEYLQFSIEFRRAADAITKAANESNLDAAALAYVTMTLKCVDCHKHIRDIRMAGRFDELPNRFVQR